MAQAGPFPETEHRPAQQRPRHYRPQSLRPRWLVQRIPILHGNAGRLPRRDSMGRLQAQAEIQEGEVCRGQGAQVIPKPLHGKRLWLGDQRPPLLCCILSEKSFE